MNKTEKPSVCKIYLEEIFKATFLYSTVLLKTWVAKFKYGRTAAASRCCYCLNIKVADRPEC